MSISDQPPQSTWTWADYRLPIGIAVAAVGLAGVAGFYRLRSRLARYAMRPASSYHLTPKAPQRFTLPASLDVGKAEYTYATVPVRPDSAIAKDPLPAFVKAFYAHPYFKFEGTWFKWINYAGKPRAPGHSLGEIAPNLPSPSALAAGKPGDTYVGGLFTVLDRSFESMLVIFTTPSTWLKGRGEAVAGGTQEFGARTTDKGTVELSYGLTHFNLDKNQKIKESSLELLRWDQRYLFNSAVKRFEKMAR